MTGVLIKKNKSNKILDDISWVSNIIMIDPMERKKRNCYPKESWCVGFEDNEFQIKHLFDLYSYNSFQDPRFGGRISKTSSTWSYFNSQDKKKYYHIFCCPTEEIAKKLSETLNIIPDKDYKNIIWNIMEANKKIEELKQLVIDLNKVNTIITKIFTNPK